jgi:hypothetical protein
VNYETFLADETEWRGEMMQAREDAKSALESEWSLPEWVNIGDVMNEIHERAEGMGFEADAIVEQWEFYIRQVSPFPGILIHHTMLGVPGLTSVATRCSLV